ncbi:MAG TPA: YhjD/YihY/BrkB family envelope integrity protein, partial [Vicinamibacterales bacterium]
MSVRRASLRLRDELHLALLAIWRGFLGLLQNNDLTFASSIAYYSLLSLFPFFLLAFSILGSVTTNPTERASILNFVLRYFPRQFDFVTSQLDALQQARVKLGLAGSILMTWAAMGVFSAISSAVNHAWGVERQPSYLKHKLTAFGMLVAASLLLLVGLLLVSAVNVIEANWFAAVLERTPGLLVLEHVAVRWSSTVVFVLVVGLIFYFVPNAKVRFRDVWLGAV